MKKNNFELREIISTLEEDKKTWQKIIDKSSQTSSANSILKTANKYDKYKVFCGNEQLEIIAKAIDLCSNCEDEETEHALFFAKNLHILQIGPQIRFFKLDNYCYTPYDKSNLNEDLEPLLSLLKSESNFFKAFFPKINYYETHKQLIYDLFDDNKPFSPQSTITQDVLQQMNTFDYIENFMQLHNSNSLVLSSFGVVEDQLATFESYIDYVKENLPAVKYNYDNFGIKGMQYIEKCAVSARNLTQEILDQMTSITDAFEQDPEKVDVFGYHHVLSKINKLIEKNDITITKLDSMSTALATYDNESQFRNSDEFEIISESITDESILLENLIGPTDFTQRQNQMLNQLCDDNDKAVHDFFVIK